MSTYYTIVYRPQGSKTWTLWHGEDGDATELWFGTRASADKFLKGARAEGFTTAVSHPTLAVVPLQFAVAKVEVEE